MDILKACLLHHTQAYHASDLGMLAGCLGMVPVSSVVLAAASSEAKELERCQRGEQLLLLGRERFGSLREKEGLRPLALGPTLVWDGP